MLHLGQKWKIKANNKEIRQILEIKWEHIEAVHQLFVEYKKAYDSVMQQDLYNIPIQFGIHMKR